MIITNVCLLLEALSLVMCLHHLNGKKFILDILTVCYLSIDMISMVTINYFELPRTYTMIIYPFLFLFCGLKFGFDIKKMMLNTILCVVIVGGIQLIAAVPICYLLDVHFVSNYRLLMVNCLAFLIICGILPKLKINKLSRIVIDKEKILFISLVTCIVIVAVCIINYKEIKSLELNQAVLLFISILFIFILAGQLSLYKLKAKEAETELKMHKLYADSFQTLIEDIKSRQHEFDNHIHTIRCQCYVCNTYDELVKAQEDYYQMVIEENRFNKLLSKGNPVIIGFLYGKFIEMDKMGIAVTYKVNIKDLEVGIPIYKIIEILGNLIKNAIEALENTDNVNRFFLCVEEVEQGVTIEVMNESPIIDYNEITNFFSRGYSRKGGNRGLGLYNVKKICNEYKLNISCRNVEMEKTNWLSFKVTKEEAT